MSISEQLRQMLLDDLDSGTNLNKLAAAAGVRYASLHGFLYKKPNGEYVELKLSMVDKLTAYYGVRLTAPRKGKRWLDR